MKAIQEYLRGSIYKYVDHDLLRMAFDEDTIAVAQDMGWLTMRPTRTQHYVVYTINFSALV
jgi:hypothetical protein